MLQDPKKARTAQTQKWSENCQGGQVQWRITPVLEKILPLARSRSPDPYRLMGRKGARRQAGSLMQLLRQLAAERVIALDEVTASAAPHGVAGFTVLDLPAFRRYAYEPPRWRFSKWRGPLGGLSQSQSRVLNLRSTHLHRKLQLITRICIGWCAWRARRSAHDDPCPLSRCPLWPSQRPALPGVQATCAGRLYGPFIARYRRRDREELRCREKQRSGVVRAHTAQLPPRPTACSWLPTRIARERNQAARRLARTTPAAALAPDGWGP